MTCDHCHGPVPDDDPDVVRGSGDHWTCGDCAVLRDLEEEMTRDRRLQPAGPLLKLER